jgi:hypothetical protein
VPQAALPPKANKRRPTIDASITANLTRDSYASRPLSFNAWCRGNELAIRYLPGNAVANTPRNGYRVVAATLVIAADQSGVHGLFHTM